MYLIALELNFIQIFRGHMNKQKYVVYGKNEFLLLLVGLRMTAWQKSWNKTTVDLK